VLRDPEGNEFCVGGPVGAGETRDPKSADRRMT